MNRRAVRFAAALGAVTLAGVAVAPAFAATTVSQATASAIELSIGGQDAYSGEVKATNDGTGETVTGEVNPPISVLGGQDLLNVGVLAQDATATVDGSDGVSAACAGVAGNGGSTSPLANVGESNCLTPGEPVGLSILNLDLTGVVVIDPASALGPLAAANPALEAVLAGITAPLSEAIAGTPLGDLAIGGNFGAVEAHCRAVPGSATGDSNIVDTTGGNADTPITFTLGGETVTLLNLPASAPPNTKLLTDLDKVTEAILGAVETELRTALAESGATGPLAPLAALPEALQDQVIVALVEGLQPLLQPLEENVLDVTLNKQVPFPATDEIEVTALELKLLPAAAESPLAASLVDLVLAKVSCGPNGRVGATPPPPGETPPGGDQPDAGPGPIPTSVDSGLAGDSGNGQLILVGTGALMLLAGATGLMGYRRMLQR